MSQSVLNHHYATDVFGKLSNVCLSVRLFAYLSVCLTQVVLTHDHTTDVFTGVKVCRVARCHLEVCVVVQVCQGEVVAVASLRCVVVACARVEPAALYTWETVDIVTSCDCRLTGEYTLIDMFIYTQKITHL